MVINCAGNYGDDVENLRKQNERQPVDNEPMQINPYKGEFCVYENGTKGTCLECKIMLPLATISMEMRFPWSKIRKL